MSMSMMDLVAKRLFFVSRRPLLSRLAFSSTSTSTSSFPASTTLTFPSTPAANNEISRLSIPSTEYHERRTKLVDDLDDGSVVIIPGYGTRYKANGIFYPFTQASSFEYITGLKDPDAGVVLIKDSSTAKSYKMVLYVRARNKEMEVWDGKRVGTEGAVSEFGADEAFPITDFPRHLCDILGDVASRNSNLYTDLILTPAHESDSSASHNASQSAPGSDPSLASIFKTLPRSSHANVFKDILSGVRIHSLKPRLDALRLIKSPSEISLLRRAGQVTGRSLNNLLKNLGPLSENFTTPIPESLIQSTLYHASSLQLADPYAYVPVIAGGDRGLTLHYTQNNRLVHPGQGMLLDYGAEFKSYPADVTRTFVLSKKFPTPFREIYDLVLTVQRDIIKLCIPGTTLDALHNESFSRLRRGLTSLFGRRVSEADLRRYYPHHVGHYLGMDIHDTETISKRTIFKAGMVITVEPGLYLPPHTTIPTKYHNVAVRIEDTILVTEAGPVILSVEGVKEVVDIENLIS